MRLLFGIVKFLLTLAGAVSIAAALLHGLVTSLLAKAGVEMPLGASECFYLGAGLIGLSGLISALTRKGLARIFGALLVVAAIAAIVVEASAKPI